MNNKLPEFCYSTRVLDGSTIKIKRGEMGFYPTNTYSTVDELNELLGVTKAQVEAMTVGSIFGWEVPSADPDMYDNEGKPKNKKE